MESAKRKFNLLPYDPSGLRTTKTTNWASLTPVLERRARPNHLPGPEWLNDWDAMQKAREDKGLPPAIGRPVPGKMSANYTEVQW